MATKYVLAPAMGCWYCARMPWTACSWSLFHCLLFDLSVTAHSSFLTYAATASPLAGIDAVYVLYHKANHAALDQFYSSSGLLPSEVHAYEMFDRTDLRKWTSGLETIFGGNTFNSRRSIVAHALSHFTLWRHIATTTDQLHLVIEDSATFAPGFVDLWKDRKSVV